MNVEMIPSLLLMALGFGFVIFWHELGHFLAAKWAGVRVDQFAIGFGRAIVSWRKGVGLRRGSSADEFERIARDTLARLPADSPILQNKRNERDRLDAAAASVGVSETEYRLNWIPFGGYVKMLGQDDSNPNVKSDSPRSYTSKPVGKRMVIVSAGVLMNILLAAMLFVILFLYGFDAPAAKVGYVSPGSPADQAGIRVGDELVEINGHVMHDFSKVSFNVALLPPGKSVPVVIKRDGETLSLSVVARRNNDTGNLMFGIGPMSTLHGPDARQLRRIDLNAFPPNRFPVRPGEVITAINGTPVADTDYVALYNAVQNAFGKPVELTITSSDGTTRTQSITCDFTLPFNNAPLNFLGLEPGAAIDWVSPGDTTGLRSGDVIARINRPVNNAEVVRPSFSDFLEIFSERVASGAAAPITVLRDGVEKTIQLDRFSKLRATFRVNPEPIVSSIVPASPAARAEIAAGSRITSINGSPVESWHDVHRALLAVGASTIEIGVQHNGDAHAYTLHLSDAELAAAKSNRYDVEPRLAELIVERQTKNPLTAIAWGVGETRDLIVKTYLVIRRMTVDRSVSPRNLMGPLGLLESGTLAAYRGTDWLIWFLAMVSANLAVVNFLPIPIVDGGLFCFLLAEKITGKPPSEKIQGAAHLVGFVLIIGLFLFVTFNDLTRIFGG